MENMLVFLSWVAHLWWLWLIIALFFVWLGWSYHKEGDVRRTPAGGTEIMTVETWGVKKGWKNDMAQLFFVIFVLAVIMRIIGSW